MVNSTVHVHIPGLSAVLYRYCIVLEVRETLAQRKSLRAIQRTPAARYTVLRTAV
jgi:hypothetical protein